MVKFQPLANNSKIQLRPRAGGIPALFNSLTILEIILKPISCLALFVSFLCCFCGCKNDNLPKTVPAEGIVTLDGTPVSDATVLLIADTGSNNAYAVSDKDGKFKLKAFDEKAGAVPGSYKVEITKTIKEAASVKGGETGVNLKYGLPVKYAGYATSGLTFKIGNDGDKNIKFALVSK